MNFIKMAFSQELQYLIRYQSKFIFIIIIFIYLLI